MKFGILFRPQSFWIGCHWSPKNKRFCLNILPFITFWLVSEGGIEPKQGYNLYRNDAFTTFGRLLCKFKIHSWSYRVCPSTHLQFPTNNQPYRYQKKHKECVCCGKKGGWTEICKTPLEHDDYPG